MASSKDVLAQALTLPLKQRARIAHELIASLDEGPPEDPSEVAKAWDDEIVRRVEDLKAGRATAALGVRHFLNRCRFRRSRDR